MFTVSENSVRKSHISDVRQVVVIKHSNCGIFERYFISSLNVLAGSTSTHLRARFMLPTLEAINRTVTGDVPMDTPGKNAIGSKKVGDSVDFRSYLESGAMVSNSSGLD